MSSDSDNDKTELPWFRRFLPDGTAEPHAALGDNGQILIICGDGWAASFKNGKWHPGIAFSHDEVAQFTPVKEQRDIFRLLSEARSAVGDDT